MSFVFIWEQTATCATYSINWLVCITEKKGVYCAVRTGSLNKAVCASSLKRLIKSGNEFLYSTCLKSVTRSLKTKPLTFFLGLNEITFMVVPWNPLTMWNWRTSWWCPRTVSLAGSLLRNSCLKTQQCLKSPSRLLNKSALLHTAGPIICSVCPSDHIILH